MRHWLGLATLLAAISLNSFATGPELVDDTKTRFDLEKISCVDEKDRIRVTADTIHSSYEPGKLSLLIQPRTQLVTEVSYTDQWEQVWTVQKTIHGESDCKVEKLTANWENSLLKSITISMRCQKLSSQHQNFLKGFSVESEIPCPAR